MAISAACYYTRHHFPPIHMPCLTPGVFREVHHNKLSYAEKLESRGLSKHCPPAAFLGKPRPASASANPVLVVYKETSFAQSRAELHLSHQRTPNVRGHSVQCEESARTGGQHHDMQRLALTVATSKFRSTGNRR